MKRKITVVLGVLILVAGFAAMKFLSSKAKPPARTADGSGMPIVLAGMVKNSVVPNKIEVTGKLQADKRIEIFSEVQGVLLSSSKVFKEGERYSEGQQLLRIDSSEFYLNLMATKSSYLNALIQLGPDIKFDFPEAYENWNKYVASIDVRKPLPDLPKTDSEKQKNFLTSRDVYKQYFTIKSQEEKLTKYNLKVPFSGVLSEGNLQPGTMIRMGQKLGSLIKPGSYELEVSVNLNQINSIDVGDSVKLYSQDIPGEWIGRVKRISQSIDKTTQTAKVYVSLVSETLKEGMYLSGHILTDGFPNAFVVQRNLLMGIDQVFVIEDSTLVLTQVNVLSIGESEVVVNGLNDGQLILGQVFSGAYNGLKVSPKVISE